MNTLHLFAGAGGGIIADMMLGHHVVGAVEIDKYCRQVLQARQKDRLIPEFPIYEDVCQFRGDEIEEQVDCISGGFPCQDISTAGQGKGIYGERSGLFFELFRICSFIRPKYVFLENSPAIIKRGLNTVLECFASIGYDAQWTCLSAAQCGAWHRRKRWWGLFKRSDSNGKRKLQQERYKQDEWRWSDNICKKLSDTECTRLEGFRPKSREETFTEPRDSGLYVSNTTDSWMQWWNWSNEHDKKTEREGDYYGGGTQINESGQWWHSEPGLGRVANGVAHRVDRLKALGNGQVPIVAAIAFTTLMRRYHQ